MQASTLGGKMAYRAVAGRRRLVAREGSAPPISGIVRLVASGICHTNIDFCDSGGAGSAVLGHDGAGVVERVGKSVKGVRAGDHVVLSYVATEDIKALIRARRETFEEESLSFMRVRNGRIFNFGLRRSGARA